MKKTVLVLSSLLALSFIPSCACQGKNFGKTSKIDVKLTKDNHLDGGDITMNNTYLHFDEKSVNENPNDAFIEIGGFGAIYLQNYVPGIARVFVEAVRTEDYRGEFFLATSSTPNAVEYFSLYSSTTSFVNMNLDRPYFSIHNRLETPLLIKTIEITGESDNSEQALMKKIKMNDKVYRYEENMEPVRPYDNYLKEEDIPDNRIVKTIGPDAYYLPGQYTIGYEVYSKTKEGGLGKMLYSSTATLSIEGTKNQAEYNAIFHLPNNEIAWIPVKLHQQVDLRLNSKISPYNWNSPYNDLTTPFNGDRHYYPVYSVIGMPTNKDGDGCTPISTTYSAVEKTFTLPEPVMDPGYQFGGWFMDHDCQIPFDESVPHEGNLTLYANCIETEKTFRKVYYHDYDGRLMNTVEYLYEGESLPLLEFALTDSKLINKNLMYEVIVGSNVIASLRPRGNYEGLGEYDGDRLDYDLIKDVAGDIHLYVSKYELYDNGPANYTRLSVDADQNDIINGIQMPLEHHEGDVILPGRYVKLNTETYLHDFDIYTEPKRSGEFLVTDEVDGYLMDQSSYNSIASYGYGNKAKEHAKPLAGILRHESVLKVGRRAFFNRYGLKGTYFPRNAREFDAEAYADVEFNEYLFLPKGLTNIGRRAFISSKSNGGYIKYVALPKTIKSVGKDAFALGDYDASKYEYKNIKNRTTANELITFFYEGSEEEYNRLDEATRLEIENNALKVVFNVKYNPFYGR